MAMKTKTPPTPRVPVPLAMSGACRTARIMMAAPAAATERVHSAVARLRLRATTAITATIAPKTDARE